jgi:hypothetical protein
MEPNTENTLAFRGGNEKLFLLLLQKSDKGSAV